ncbi:Amino-acid acetyltransferase [Anaerobiospirillum thomasii]|uniref:GNAT family N-acetyltransferase n=1 Tax=Anaerobiospirillum thomasii TaxID=179995 RepID=UPI000D8EB3A9|nr:GNAT family N-acetyltransferase [Anaerobiospirillum thomasii]SPT71676.1 Amino-acid acetyltransferase [Anaerobiospirillum thomasii]
MSINTNGQATSAATEHTLDAIRHVSIDDLYSNAQRLLEQNLLSQGEFNSITSSLNEIASTLDSKNPQHYLVRQARLSDIDSLEAMVKYWAAQGENLPRSRDDLIRNILSFAVCVKDNVVVGCACLYVYDSGLAEIRSLGVSPMIQRQGQGRAIVQFLLKRAQKMEIKKVFVLTRNATFFAKVGFDKTVIEALPEKILKDCDKCPKKDRCDEVAYEFNFSYQDNKNA